MIWQTLTLTMFQVILSVKLLPVVLWIGFYITKNNVEFVAILCSCVDCITPSYLYSYMK